MGENHYVNVIIENGLGTIEFFHPAHNSLPGDMLSRIVSAVNDLSLNNDVKLILIKSSGDRTFCAGASFTELSSINDLETGKKFFMGFANVINAIRKSSKLVLMAVQGKAVGGGVGLASAADYCFATKWSSIRLSELAVGIGPFVIGPAVERKVGFSAFSKMALTPDVWQTAEWSKQHGLFHEVAEDKNEMDQQIDTVISKLKAYNPEALTELKKVFWQGTEHWDELLAERAATSGRLVLTKPAKDAINAFLQG